MPNFHCNLITFLNCTKSLICINFVLALWEHLLWLVPHGFYLAGKNEVFQVMLSSILLSGCIFSSTFSVP